MGSRTIIRNIPKERLMFEKITKKRFWFILFPFLVPVFIYYMYTLASFNFDSKTIFLVFFCAFAVSFIFLGVCNIKFQETGFEILYDFFTKSDIVYFQGGEIVSAKKNIRIKKRKK